MATPPPERAGCGPAPASWHAVAPGLLAITVLPLAVYVISYIPWINLGNQWFAGFPAGHTGQTFLDLQNSMYEYHNNLRATHPASSPWWAWPLDLKPVWFYQSGYAGGTTAVIYDTGNLGHLLAGHPGHGVGRVAAWKRRSLALAVVVIAVLCMWLPWARIDRATFQYHVYTSLPFSFMALAYFLAELWHGPSPRTGSWRELCGCAGDHRGAAVVARPRATVRPGQHAAGQRRHGGVRLVSRDFTLTGFQLIGVLLAIGGLVMAGVLVYMTMRNSSTISGGARPLLVPIAFSMALLGAVLVVVGAASARHGRVPGQGHRGDAGLIALVLLAVPACFVLRGRDPAATSLGCSGRHRLVRRLLPELRGPARADAAVADLPGPAADLELGLPVRRQPRPARSQPDRLAERMILVVAVTGLCIAAIYAVRTWRAVRGESDEPSEPRTPSEPSTPSEPQRAERAERAGRAGFDLAGRGGTNRWAAARAVR